MDALVVGLAPKKGASKKILKVTGSSVADKYPETSEIFHAGVFRPLSAALDAARRALFRSVLITAKLEGVPEIWAFKGRLRRGHIWLVKSLRG